LRFRASNPIRVHFEPTALALPPDAGDRILTTKRAEGFMPEYEFECKMCGHQFSRVMTIDQHDKEKVRCPKCDSKDVKHVIEASFVTTDRKT
jgi:putative FmdB family regulatory protein